MKVFDPPYRWAARPVANLRHCFWDVVRGVRNVWRWTPVIWDDYDGDWEPLARVIVYKLRRMEPVMRHGHLKNGERHAREIAICAAVLERVIRNEYLDEARHSLDAYRKAEAEVKADLELFGKMFTRHLRSWWD